MEIIVHRGTHQIGGTCIEINSPQTRIIFDVGAELPDINDPNKQKAILEVNDLFKTSKLTERKIDGIFISHNHGDHLGLINEVRSDIPIYIGKSAADIHNTISDFTYKENKITVKENLIHKTPIIINEITITPYLIDHSAFDAYAFLIEGGGKRIIYTGDFRRHGVKGSLTVLFSKLSKTHNVDALLIEGTNLYKDGFVAESENSISERAKKFMTEIKGNVFVLMSSVNIDRITQIYKAAKATKRLLLMDIFTASIMTRLNENIPNPITFKDVEIFYPFFLKEGLFASIDKKLKNKFSADELKNRNDLCIIVRENMLPVIIKKMNYSNSGLIYSKWEEYKKEIKTKKFVDFFEKNNLQNESIHTSGHADVSTIVDFVNAIQPKKIIPVHTNTPEKYKELFGNKVILVNDKNQIVV